MDSDRVGHIRKAMRYGVKFCHHESMTRRTHDALLGLLADGEPWTGLGIAERLGVSLRTVRRAVADLRASGIVIDGDPGRGGGIRLRGRAGLPRLRLEHTEVVSLLLALALAESARLPVLGSGLPGLRDKLSLAFAESSRRELGTLRRRILIGRPASDAVRASWRTPAARVAGSVQDAFVARRVMSFLYVDGAGARTSRDVEPQCLLLNAPVWYVLAHDLARGAPRSFRMDRMLEPEVHGRRFALRTVRAMLPDGIDGVAPL